MSNHRKTLPATRSKAGDDLKADFSYNELLSGILEDLGDRPAPKREEGWFTIRDLVEKAGGFSETQIRRIMKEKVKAGEYEQVEFKKIAYFRKIRDELERSATEI